MAKHKTFICVTKNTAPRYVLLELDAYEAGHPGSCVTNGDENTYYFERKERRDLFSDAIKALGVEIVKHIDTAIED